VLVIVAPDILVSSELIYISVSAVEIGVSKDFSFYIIAIANAASAFGRVSSGLLGDKIGRSRQLWTMGTSVNVRQVYSTPWQFSLLSRESRQSHGHMLKINLSLLQ